MWVPKTEIEIVEAVTRGSLEESASFDAKRELPSKNAEIAKDVAAMANDGGVLIYGIGEDEHRRPTRLNPIPIVQQPERVTAIVQTGIAEPPRISVSCVPTSSDPSQGYLVVVIPPSDRAPHMVIVKGENRYYGRSATGNMPLGEGEIARLYERRRRFEIDRDALLAVEINRAPLPPIEGFAYLHLIAQPVFRSEDIFCRAVGEGEQPMGFLSELLRFAADPSVFDKRYSPDFSSGSHWTHCDEGFSIQLDYPRSDNDASHTLNLQIDRDGSGHLFCGRAGEQSGRDPFWFFPTVAAGNTTRFLAFLGNLYAKTHYLGMVDLGLAIRGLRGSSPYGASFPVPYDRDEYRRTARLSALSLKEDPSEEARGLLMPLFQAMSQGSVDPF